jgi:AraC-like DNA-binding protein
MPLDKRLRTACAALLHEPGRPETLEAWLDIAGASSRTLARLFADDTGMRFVDWRRQAPLADVLVRLVRISAMRAQRLHRDVSQGAR